MSDIDKIIADGRKKGDPLNLLHAPSWLGRERCGSCRYWERREGTQLCPQPRVGRCHRFPSLPDAGYGTAVEADLDWCGEFQPRPGATPEGESRYEV